MRYIKGQVVQIVDGAFSGRDTLTVGEHVTIIEDYDSEKDVDKLLRVISTRGWEMGLASRKVTPLEYKGGDLVEVTHKDYHGFAVGSLLTVERESGVTNKEPSYLCKSTSGEARQVLFVWQLKHAGEKKEEGPSGVDRYKLIPVQWEFIRAAWNEANPTWRDKISKAVEKENVFSPHVKISAMLIWEAGQDREICFAWKEKLKKQFPTIFPNKWNFENGHVLDSFSNAKKLLPFAISKDTTKLYVNPEWEPRIVSGPKADCQYIEFIKK